jgi:Fe-S oxidoreductase
MTNIKVPLIADLIAQDITPDVLFWVGCAGSFDQRAQKITKAFVKILNHLNISYAVLGPEEACTGDPARRAGNEFLFQMMASQNIQILNGYNVKKIVTTCPHCFNTLKNEYPELGGNYEVTHHSQLLQEMIDSGRLKVEGGAFKGQKITFHDSCYLGRGNDVYTAPRRVIEALDVELVEMKRSKKNGFCCGAGGAQVFKEAEHGSKEVYAERTEEALNTGANIIAMGCPFCMTMLSTGVTDKDKADQVKTLDIAELIETAMDL